MPCLVNCLYSQTPPDWHRQNLPWDRNRAATGFQAGLPKDFRPLHGLRHAYASMLASSGLVDMYTLQKLLTHKSPVMTQRYAHLRDESLKKAADLAGELINESLNPRNERSYLENTLDDRSTQN